MFEPVCIKGVKALFIVSLIYIITMIIFSAQSDPIIIYHVMLLFFSVFLIIQTCKQKQSQKQQLVQKYGTVL